MKTDTVARLTKVGGGGITSASIAEFAGRATSPGWGIGCGRMVGFVLTIAEGGGIGIFRGIGLCLSAGALLSAGVGAVLEGPVLAGGPVPGSVLIVDVGAVGGSVLIVSTDLGPISVDGSVFIVGTGAEGEDVGDVGAEVGEAGAVGGEASTFTPSMGSSTAGSSSSTSSSYPSCIMMACAPLSAQNAA